MKPPLAHRSRRWFAFVISLATAALCTVRAGTAAGPIDWATAKSVSIATVEYRFEPDELVFEHNRVYRLQVVNRGNELHELTAPAFLQTILLHDASALNAQHTEIAVQPGERKAVTFLARRPGHFKMWCADHDWAGMTGTITIR